LRKGGYFSIEQDLVAFSLWKLKEVHVRTPARKRITLQERGA
jgi:hypothetical protein